MVYSHLEKPGVWKQGEYDAAHHSCLVVACDRAYRILLERDPISAYHAYVLFVQALYDKVHPVGGKVELSYLTEWQDSPDMTLDKLLSTIRQSVMEYE